MAVPDSFDQPISDWDSSLYGNNVYMDQSVGFDNDSGSTLTTDAIADCDPIGIQNAGKIRKRMVPCGEKAPSVEPQNIPEAEPVQAGITDKRPPQIPPGILRYHPDKVPTRDKTHKIPDFWNLPVLAPDSSSSCPGIQEGADMEALYYVCDSGFDLDVIVNLLFGYTILQNASLGIISTLSKSIGRDTYDFKRQILFVGSRVWLGVAGNTMDFPRYVILHFFSQRRTLPLTST